MSKHSSADDKLHISRQVRSSNSPRLTTQPGQAAPQVPAKGSNANNQYR